MSRTLFLAFLGLLAITSFAQIESPCESFIAEALAYYNVTPLQDNHTSFSYTSGSKTIDFNLCKAVPNPCSTAQPTSAVINDGLSCSRLTADPFARIYAIDNLDATAGLSLNFSDGDTIPNTNLKYKFRVYLNCSTTQDYAVTEFKADDSTGEYIIYANSTQGCPTWGRYMLNDFFSKYKIIFVIVGVIVGLFECFFGLKLFNPTLFITGFLVLFLLFVTILFSFALSPTSSAGAQWGCLIGSAVLGLIGGVLLIKLEKVGVFLLGVWLGVIGASLLFSLVVSHFGSHADIWGIVIMVVMGILGGILAIFIFEHAIIIATALGGSYIAFKALSLVLPTKLQFPSEIAIATQISQKDFKGIPVAFYVYFVLVIILALIGIFVQYRHRRSRQAEKEHEHHGFDKLGYPTHAYTGIHNA